MQYQSQTAVRRVKLLLTMFKGFFKNKSNKILNQTRVFLKIIQCLIQDREWHSSRCKQKLLIGSSWKIRYFGYEFDRGEYSKLKPRGGPSLRPTSKFSHPMLYIDGKRNTYPLYDTKAQHFRTFNLESFLDRSMQINPGFYKRKRTITSQGRK